jgi:hypothetical protein
VLRINKLPGVIMALTVSLAACTEGDGTGLDDVAFDPELSAADLQAVQGAFAAAVFENLALLSGDLNQVVDPPTQAVALLQASLEATTADGHWEAAALAQAFAAGPAWIALIPVDYLGRVYDRNVDGRYQHNTERTDGPELGVRFILYERHPDTHEPGAGVIGYVDLLDESTDLAFIIRVVVVTDEVERINYTVSAELESLALTVSGFIGDCTNEVHVDLSMSFVHDFPVSIATVEHLVSVPERDFEVDVTAIFEFNDLTLQSSIDVDATCMQGDHTVTVDGLITFSEGDVPSEDGAFEIHVDGQLFATITVDGDTITVRNATGGELISAHAQAVRTIFDGLKEMLDERFEDFLRPVDWLCHVN